MERPIEPLSVLEITNVEKMLQDNGFEDVEETTSYIRGVCWRLGCAVADIDDISQSVWVDVIGALERRSGPMSHPKKWLFTVTKHRVYRHWRDRARKPETSVEYTSSEFEEIEQEYLNRNEIKSTQDIAEVRQILSELTRHLSARQQRILKLVGPPTYLSSQTEIAKILGVSKATVCLEVGRIKALIECVLSPEDPDDGGGARWRRRLHDLNERECPGDYRRQYRSDIKAFLYQLLDGVNMASNSAIGAKMELMFQMVGALMCATCTESHDVRCRCDMCTPIRASSRWRQQRGFEGLDPNSVSPKLRIMLYRNDMLERPFYCDDMIRSVSLGSELRGPVFRGDIKEVLLQEDAAKVCVREDVADRMIGWTYLQRREARLLQDSYKMKEECDYDVDSAVGVKSQRELSSNERRPSAVIDGIRSFLLGFPAFRGAEPDVHEPEFNEDVGSNVATILKKEQIKGGRYPCDNDTQNRKERIHRRNRKNDLYNCRSMNSGNRKLYVDPQGRWTDSLVSKYETHVLDTKSVMRHEVSRSVPRSGFRRIERRRFDIEGEHPCDVS